MKFGLWFATSWGSQSCWDYLPAWGGADPPPLTYRNGHAAMTDYTGSFCLAAEPYFSPAEERRAAPRAEQRGPLPEV